MTRLSPYGLALVALISEPTPSEAQAAPPRPVREALLAQVIGLGGCTHITSASSMPVRFFPRVHFWEGTCTLEHGDIATPVAAIDDSGLVYVLDSESAFAFLTRLHPPLGLDSTSVVEYVKEALVMQGKLPRDATFLTNRASAPRELCRATGLDCEGLFLPRIRDNGRTVYLTAFTEGAIYSAGPIGVDLDSGAVFAVVEKWTEHGSRLQ